MDCKLYYVFDSTLHVLVTGNGEVSNVLNWCKRHYQEHFDKFFQLSGYIYIQVCFFFCLQEAFCQQRQRVPRMVVHDKSYDDGGNWFSGGTARGY